MCNQLSRMINCLIGFLLICATFIISGSSSSQALTIPPETELNPPISVPIRESLAPDQKQPSETILIFPKRIDQFVQDYPSWEYWLAGRDATAYAVRDELLVSIYAAAALIPDLEIQTDEPYSDLVIVSGNPGMIWALRERLRLNPLIEDIQIDSELNRENARQSWQERDVVGSLIDQSIPFINIRNPRATNVVWGVASPEATVQITLTRPGSQSLNTTVKADSTGKYYGYLKWEIRDGDAIEVSDGQRVGKVGINPLELRIGNKERRVEGLLSLSNGLPGEGMVVIGGERQRLKIHPDGKFEIDEIKDPFVPGTPGFLSYQADIVGNRVYQPFATPVVNVRRDTSWGLPYGSSHSAGVSTIVWGYASPYTDLTITLNRPGEFEVIREMRSDPGGYFSVSVDRFIEDGDDVEVTDGVDTSMVQVPVLSFDVDPETKIISGIGPVNITSTEYGAPHTLGVFIGGNQYQLTTSNSGAFSETLAANPYLAGLLGSIFYTTPEGNWVYKPIFVVEPFARGVVGDWWADTILGQPDFSQIIPNQVVANRLYNPMGTYVDRSVIPNRVYIYDGGNSRVLGLSKLGACSAGSKAGQACTSDSDCPGSSCDIDETGSADIVLGQPSFNSSGCNLESGYQLYPDTVLASAETLCGLREEQLSISEGGSGVSMASDSLGNLYVPDFFNNRVLRYDDPFNTDTYADGVWGQDDFSGITCNRGSGVVGHTDATSLCFAPPPGIGDLRAGVAVDTEGNLWVADNMNNRVLRFPFTQELGRPAQEADLVLGQPDFSSNSRGSEISQLNQPVALRVDDDGNIVIADSLNNRILIFEPPLSNGMDATQILEDNLSYPSGLEFELDGGLWVDDSSNNRIIRLMGGVEDQIIPIDSVIGGIGIDKDKNVVVVASGSYQKGLFFSVPSYVLDATFFGTLTSWGGNQTGPQGFEYGIGLEVASGQLIYADWSRILFWDNPWELSNHQPADGLIGQPDFNIRVSPGDPWYSRMRADNDNRLWVIYTTGDHTQILAFHLPLHSAEEPIITLSSPLPLKGGGEFSWTASVNLGGIDIQPGCDCLWLSDKDYSRVFRINNLSTQPIVDLVLGQTNIDGIECNQGRGLHPSQDSLCYPGALSFDKSGNLFVADNNLEYVGNYRLLEYDAGTLLLSPPSVIFGIPATSVIGRNDDFTEFNCLPLDDDPMCGPWEPAFDSLGRMVVGFNGYDGPRFPMVYQDPLSNPFPITALGDFHSMPLSARFDQFGNFYILDHNRSRILIYKQANVETYTISGLVTSADGTPLSDVTIQAIGYASNDVTDESGFYELEGLIADSYTIVPSKDGYIFSPESRTVDIDGNLTGQDFTGYQVVQAGFSADPIVGVSPLGVAFTNTSIGDFDTVHWEFGDGKTSSLDNPTHTYSTPGIYTVSLTVSGLGGTDTEIFTDYITVYSQVQADFTASPTSGTAPLTVNFTNTTIGDRSSSVWEFGDGSSSSLENPIHQYIFPGIYTVQLTVNGINGSDQEIKEDYILVEEGESGYSIFLPVIKKPD